MEIRQLSEQYYVSGQLAPGDLAALAEHGFRTIVNNRPDDESPGQPASKELAAEAARLGIRYLYLPVVSGGITDENVADFARASRGLEGPVLLFCRSGARSTALWRLGQSP